MSTLIRREYPVKPGPDTWRNEDGDSLEVALSFWVRLQRDISRIAQAAELDAGADASGVVGAIEITSPDPKSGAVLVTQAGMTAFFSEHGIECATLLALDHVVCNLVEVGHVEPERELREWAGVGNVVVYRVSLALVACEPGIAG